MRVGRIVRVVVIVIEYIREKDRVGEGRSYGKPLKGFVFYF